MGRKFIRFIGGSFLRRHAMSGLLSEQPTTITLQVKSRGHRSALRFGVRFYISALVSDLVENDVDVSNHTIN